MDPANLPPLQDLQKDAFLLIQRTTMDEAVDACYKLSEAAGFVLARAGGDGYKRIILECDRHGEPGKQKRGDPLPAGLRGVCTKRCNCLFRIIVRGNGTKAMRRYHVVIDTFDHNHPPQSISLIAHSLARKRSRNVEIALEIKAGVPARTIVQHIVSPSSLTTARDVYNETARFRRQQLGGRPPHIALLDKLAEGGYEYAVNVDDANKLTGLLIIDGEHSITMLKRFPEILVMDCTYKTNKYKMPLFNVTGVTSTNSNYQVCLFLL